MTDSIDIPSPSMHNRNKGKQKATHTPRSGNGSITPRSVDLPQTPGGIDSASGSRATGTSPPDTSESNVNRHDEKGSGLSARAKGKMPARTSQTTESTGSAEWQGTERRASLLSSSLSKSEHTVVNIGEPDRPRLITCVKASQGFDWNQDIFLPSYMSEHDNRSDLEHRQDPVEDIFITDEEAEMMFPR